MKCPFIREDTVRSCAAARVGKQIPLASSDAEHERCSSPGFVSCPGYSGTTSAAGVASRCPFLRETLVEYCSAAPVPKYIPATAGLVPRCSSDRHRYCDLYLAQADPTGDRLPRAPDGRAGDGVAGDIVVPKRLWYAPNHMWLDVAEDGGCHVGADAFLAWVVGTVERVSFAAAREVDRPVAVLTVNAVDLQLVFPTALAAIAPNPFVRSDPAKVARDPYGSGWLFEGAVPDHGGGGEHGEAQDGLLPGAAAGDWMRREVERLDAFLHDRVAGGSLSGARLMADGGCVVAGIAARLARYDLVGLFNEFFSPLAGR